jgi:hypothetical protein
MNSDRFAPPTGLSDRSRKIWTALVPENARTIGRLTMLEQALQALDLCDRAQAELGTATLTVKTLGSGNVRQHPALKTLKECRAQYAQLWQALGLVHYGEDHMGFKYWLEDQERQRRQEQEQ